MIINGVCIERGLIIDEPWISKILSGEKTWEMRSKETKITGWIALIKKGSGHIVGIAKLKGCGASNPDDDCYVGDMLKRNCWKHKHCIDYISNPDLLKWNVPWFIDDAKKINPVPYKHKQGAVVWLKI